MTTKDSPDLTTSDTALNRYLYSATADNADALLGYLVIYNIAGIEPVTADEVRNWFEELELKPRYLPGPPRPDDAFERATGAAKASYPLGQRRRNHTTKGQTVTLMMRNVTRDETRIVRHLVRELADHDHEELSYEVRLAEAQFLRNTTPGLPDGAGDMHLNVEQHEVDRLGDRERGTITALLDQIARDFDNRSRYISADRLRTLVRDYIEEELRAVRVQRGLYFVHLKHAAALAALRTLVSRFDAELNRVPLPNIDEMRTMVDGAFESKAQADLESLARDIARVQADPKNYQVRKLEQRYNAVRLAAEEYQQTLDANLTTVDATLDLVKAQMASLYIAVADHATATESDVEPTDEPAADETPADQQEALADNAD